MEDFAEEMLIIDHLAIVFECYLSFEPQRQEETKVHEGNKGECADEREWLMSDVMMSDIV